MKENTDELSINSKMHAYHQQLANLNLPNISNLLTTSAQLNNIQQDSSIMSANHYHELVRNFMTQPGNCNANIASSTMASLANRLMSLNSHELSWLNADSVLMKHITETQLLIERKLQVMHAKTGTNDASRHNSSGNNSNKVSQHKQQQHQATPLNHNLALQNQQHHELYSQSQQQHQHQQQQQHQQQHHILMSPGSYLGNYAYAQQLAQLQQQQLQHHQQQQQQQFYTLATRYNNIAPANGLNSCIETTASVNGGNQPINDLTINALTTSGQLNKTVNSTAQAHLAAAMAAAAAASAMDLRTTPRPMSATPSPVGSRTGSTGSVANSKMSSGPVQHPKKMKMAEYKKMQQLAERGGTNHNNQRSNTNSFSDRQYDDTEPTSFGHHQQQHNHNHHHLNHHHQNHDENDDQNRNPTLIGDKRSPTSKRLHTDDELSAAAALAMTRTGIRHQSGADEESNNSTSNIIISNNHNNINNNNSGSTSNSTNHQNNTSTSTTASGKKYKGEFDEPNADEVSRRERMLIKPDHYHQKSFQVGDCACVIGSEFQDKTKMEALESLERWRSSDVEERTKWKWDINDLPKEITLPDIKKYEDLRREFSNGQADFGGASKRRPLGIRGTRQFLLMLYCLWGHPGRDDPMQREGYCPHCFARIRTENEQSTLVRVVNHFNMKHKKGANPRLSPHSENRQSPKAQLPVSPQSFQVSDTLMSMVESAAAAADDDDVEEVVGVNNTDEEQQIDESTKEVAVVPLEKDDFNESNNDGRAAASTDSAVAKTTSNTSIVTDNKSTTYKDMSNHAQATDKDNNVEEKKSSK